MHERAWRVRREPLIATLHRSDAYIYGCGDCHGCDHERSGLGSAAMSRVTLLAAASGTLFGAGLTIGGMTNPARVRGFLDIFGDWDPTLAFVMGGAVIVMAFAWAIQRRMDTPRWASSFKLPDTSDLTPKLLGGSAIFGIGWGSRACVQVPASQLW